MKKINIEIAAENKKVILLDYEYIDGKTPLPVIIFCHGLKGFKDWGAWDLMGNMISKSGFLFIKFNFSHNGGTPEQPLDFPDLESFGNNNYSIELRDLNRVLDWLERSRLPYDKNQINLMGHSRAGGITTITAAGDNRVSKLVTLAGVADYEERFPKDKELEKWKKEGIQYVKNGRTNQEMPFYYQMYEDFIANKEQLHILNAASRLTVPHLIIHGTNDPTVSVNDARQLVSKSPMGQLSLIRGANHVFGAAHPWENDLLPFNLRQAIQCVINFLRN